MTRKMTVALLTLLALTGAIRADEPEELRASDVTQGAISFHRVDSMRELWVGLPGGGVSAEALLKTLRSSCDDTTAVAVIDTNMRDKVAANEGELSVLRTVAARSALGQLKEELALNPRWTRVIVVGVLESCVNAVALADHKDVGVDGVLLIDPPVEDLPPASHRVARVGVDVLLHPRSSAEFEREEARIIESLGDWGSSARVIRGRGHFDSIETRLVELRGHVRGYSVLEDGEHTDLRVDGILKEWKDRNVIVVGELHGNPGAHLAQLEALKVMVADGGKLALSTEQFERDVQEHLDAYLADEITEAEFLQKSRPWPNYADYRPLIEFCKANNVHVIAGNIPRPLASRIFKEGVDSFEDFSEEEKSWSAAELHAPPGAYKDKFMGVMGGTDGHSDRLESMYAAQCIKDDTMAESITKWLNANPGGRVLHINGAFHSAGGLGVPEKLEAMLPEVKLGLITCVQGDETYAAPEEWILRVPSSRPMRRAPESIPEHR